MRLPHRRSLPVYGNGQYHAVHVGGLGAGPASSALLPSTPAEIRRVARTAGHRALYLAEKNITTHKILTPAAFENAIKVHAAIGGSTNAMIHLPAIAHELGWELKPELFDRINNEIPYLTNIQPSGEYVTEMMWFAGGVPMVQWYLRDYLDLDVLTVTGRTLGDNTKCSINPASLPATTVTSTITKSVRRR